MSSSIYRNKKIVLKYMAHIVNKKNINALKFTLFTCKLLSSFCCFCYDISATVYFSLHQVVVDSDKHIECMGLVNIYVFRSTDTVIKV